MTRHLYKHLLGWPVTFEDLRVQDEDYYNSLKKFPVYNSEDLAALCLDFTILEETFGLRSTVELIPNGSNIDVTVDNLPQYLEAVLMYRTLNRCKPQITELMLGFFDVIPEPALTVFDPNELESIFSWEILHFYLLLGGSAVSACGSFRHRNSSRAFAAGGVRVDVCEVGWSTGVPVYSPSLYTDSKIGRAHV